MPAQEPYQDVDWIISNNSDVHVAKHQEWFTNYTSFHPETTSILGGSMKVLDVGDVHLEVRPEQGQPTLVLRNVLHCPSSTCNIFGLARMGEGYEMQLAGPDAFWLRHLQTRTVYLLDHVVLWKLLLMGQEKGQSSLSPAGMYSIQVSWPKSERDRFEAQKAGTEQSVSAGAVQNHLEESGGGQPGIKAA